jgi:hypothetical protein
MASATERMKSGARENTGGGRSIFFVKSDRLLLDKEVYERFYVMFLRKHIESDHRVNAYQPRW